MADFLFNNWYLLIVAIAVIAIGGYAVYGFVKKPTTEQFKEVKEWLLHAVAAAEKELGSGTGVLKLRYVYDLFLGKFPHLIKIISFDVFSGLVDEVLENFRDLLKENKNIDNYINGDKNNG